MKLDLLTNATVVDDAIRFVFDRSKDKLKSLNSGNEDRSARLRARGGNQRNKPNSKPGFLNS
jgi:hypothetical protein